MAAQFVTRQMKAMWRETSPWAKGATGYVKLYYIYDCLHLIVQIAIVASKYPTLFYLKVAK